MTAGADEPTAPNIKVPMTPGVLPDPNPSPVNGAVDKLTADSLYVVTADVPLLILQSPDGGLVRITPVKSPMNIFAKFADGSGAYETREYTQPAIYVLSPVKQGTCELLLIPAGVQDVESIVRQTLHVMGAQPPPDPGPEPGPGPDPVPPQPVKSFRVIFVKESGDTLNPQQSAIPGAKAIRDYLNAKCTDGNAGWTEFDPDQIATDERPVIQKLWNAVKPQLLPTPCLVIEVNGHATVMPFPVDVAACMATLKKHRGE